MNENSTSQPISPAPAKRKRGGQPGNKNNFRYGFYSKSFSTSDKRGLDQNVKGEFHDEINIARVNLSHIEELILGNKDMPRNDLINISNVAIKYIDCIRCLTRDQKLIYQNQTTFEKALEELKKAHKNRDVPAIDSALANLNAIWQSASEEMYKNTQGAQQGPQSGPQDTHEQGGGNQKPGNDEVTDVDFEEVKDK